MIKTMTKNIKFVLLFLAHFSLLNAGKIIYLITPPRVCSTVFLRAMDARGDMVIFNEPSQYPFLKKFKPESASRIYNEDMPYTSFDKVKKALLHAAEHNDVFVKDICCAAYENLYKDNAFLANEDVIFCFLIRNPHPSLISYYKALGNRISDSGITWVVYEQLYKLYDKIARLRGTHPVVISSEELTKNPSSMMKQFCKEVEIPFDEKWLNWQKLTIDFNPMAWNDYKKRASCIKWHKNALESTHFLHCVRNYELNKEGNPTFIEISNEQRQTMFNVYNYYMSFYAPMHKHRLRLPS